MIPWYVDIVAGGYATAGAGWLGIKAIHGLNKLANPLKTQSKKMADEEFKQPPQEDESVDTKRPYIYEKDGFVFVGDKCYVTDDEGYPIDSSGKRFAATEEQAASLAELERQIKLWKLPKEGR